MKKISQQRELALQDTEALFVSVIVGNAQIGGTYIELTIGESKTAVAKGAEITNLFVGTGNSLRGATILVRTAVVDINPHTDWTIITHRLKRGNAPETTESFTCEADTKNPEADGVVLYTILYMIS